MKQSIVLILAQALCVAAVDATHISLHDQPVNHLHLYLWGYYSDLTGQHTTAQQCFETILKTEPSEYAYAGYIRHLFATKQFPKIISLAPRIEFLFPNEIDLQLILIKSLEFAGELPEADKKIMALSKIHTDHPEIVYYAAAGFVRAKRIEDALHCINTFLVKHGDKNSSFIFYFLKSQICLQIAKKEEARKSAEKCIALNPRFEQGWLLAGLIYELSGNIETAVDRYRGFLSIAGRNPIVEQQILNLTIKKSHQLMPMNTKAQESSAADQSKIEDSTNALHLYFKNHPVDFSTYLAQFRSMQVFKPTVI